MARQVSQRDLEWAQKLSIDLGLDPEMGAVVILHGTPFIRANGIYQIAEMSGEYDGCTYEMVKEDWEKNIFVAKASCYKKGCSQPFQDIGDACPANAPSSSKGIELCRVAVTRAKTRAIRSAFSIKIYALDEMDENVDIICSAPDKQAVAGQETYPSNEWKKASAHLWATTGKAGAKEPHVKAAIKQFYGVDSSKDLNAEQHQFIAVEVEQGLTLDDEEFRDHWKVEIGSSDPVIDNFDVPRHMAKTFNQRLSIEALIDWRRKEVSSG